MDYLRSYKNIYDQNIILMYKGELTFDLVTSMIGTLEERLEELKEFKNRHGNCNVSGRWSENIPLGTWVTAQRAKYRNGKLSDDRIKRLEDIGFVWNIRKR